MPLPPRPSNTAALRTLALVGASAAGKTTLIEALLHRAGVIGAPGSVERGSTVSDFDPLEHQFQHSLNSTLVHLHHRDTRVHLIDTPGYPDFIGPALTALEAVETAAVVIDASRGIEPATRRFMDVAARRGLCRLLIVNQIDVQGVDLARGRIALSMKSDGARPAQQDQGQRGPSTPKPAVKSFVPAKGAVAPNGIRFK